ncbi:MAG: OmpA family protein, partial [Pseudomonadota bacterium]
RVDGFCADNVGKAQFVPPRPSERELDPRGRAPLDPERCQLVLQWLEYRNPITFDSAEDRIARDSEPLLRTIADSLRRCGDAKLRLTGHTDSIGPRRFNLRLSRDRAIAVKDYLERRGVPTRRIVTEGFGEQYPVAGNLREDDRARNRRINLILEWGTDRELGFASRRDDRDDG